MRCEKDRFDKFDRFERFDGFDGFLWYNEGIGVFCPAHLYFGRILR